MAVAVEHLVAELRAELRPIGQLRASIEALISIISDQRDELIRSRIVNEDLRDAVRELRDAVRYQTTLLKRTG